MTLSFNLSCRAAFIFEDLTPTFGREGDLCEIRMRFAKVEKEVNIGFGLLFGAAVPTFEDDMETNMETVRVHFRVPPKVGRSFDRVIGQQLDPNSNQRHFVRDRSYVLSSFVCFDHTANFETFPPPYYLPIQSDALAGHPNTNTVEVMALFKRGNETYQSERRFEFSYVDPPILPPVSATQLPLPFPFPPFMIPGLTPDQLAQFMYPPPFTTAAMQPHAPVMFPYAPPQNS